MAWSEDFRRRLTKRPLEPMWMLAFLGANSGTHGSWSGIHDWTCESHPRHGAGNTIAIDPHSIRFDPHSVAPLTWASALGGFSLDLVRARGMFDRKVRRGNPAVLYLGWPGWGTNDFEPVAFGQLEGVQQTGGRRWTLTFCDGLGIMRSRVARALGDGTYLQDLPRTRLTDATWSASGYPKAMNVDDASGFLDTATHDMAVTVYSSSPGTGSFFRYSAKTATSFTIESDGYLGSPDDSATYSAGAYVRQVAIYDGHPMNILRRILLSTGSGTNGSGDKYLATMGLGVPQQFVDEDDITRWMAHRQPYSGSWRMQFGSYAPQVAGMDWFLGYLSRAAMWPVWRQNGYTARGAILAGQMPSDDEAFHITDDDIAIVESYDGYDPEHAAEYGEVEVSSASGSTSWSATSEFSTAPHANTLPIDLSDAVHTNEPAVRLEVASVVASWAGTVCQRVVLLCRGWRCWSRCVGDRVLLTTSRCGPPDESGATYYEAKAMVVGITPAVGPYVRVELLVASDYSVYAPDYVARAVLILHLNAGFVDSSSRAHAITQVDAPALDADAAKFGAAGLLMDGSGSLACFDRPDDFDLGAGDWSVDFWYHVGTGTLDGVLVGKGTSASAYWAIYLYGEQLWLELYVGGVPVFSQVWGVDLTYYQTWEPTTKYHVAAYRKDGVVYMTWDGTLSTTAADTSDWSPGGTALCIGGDSEIPGFGSGHVASGGIDELRICVGTVDYDGSDFSPRTGEY